MLIEFQNRTWALIWLGAIFLLLMTNTFANAASPNSTLGSLIRVDRHIDEVRSILINIGTSADLRIAVAPPQFSTDAFSDHGIAEIHHEIETGVSRTLPSNFQLVSRANLVQLLNIANNNNGSAYWQAMYTAAVDVDIILLPTFAVGTDATQFYIDVISLDGVKKYGATTANSVDNYSIIRQQQKKSYSFSRAIENITKALLNDVPQLKSIAIGGISFESSSAQTDFSIYLSDHLTSAIQEAAYNELTQRRITVQQQNVGEDLSDTTILEGSYWDLGDAIEVRLKARDATGVIFQWIGTVLRSTLPVNLTVRPEGNFDHLVKQDQAGILGLEIAVNHAPSNLYYPGDILELNISVRHDAYLYCFYVDRSQQVIRIFPNENSNKNFLEAGTFKTIPDDYMPFEFFIEPPAGFELLKCFATSETVESKLKNLFKYGAFKTLPPEFAANLSAIFRAVPGASVSEDSAAITIRQSR